ncbi:hypothetical protein TNCV_2262321 [Trichonephila clavipes]|nr:hypothetical protein TNCV_2262321 [Trichonephila clavipes]
MVLVVIDVIRHELITEHDMSLCAVPRVLGYSILQWCNVHPRRSDPHPPVRGPVAVYGSNDAGVVSARKTTVHLLNIPRQTVFDEIYRFKDLGNDGRDPGSGRKRTVNTSRNHKATSKIESMEAKSFHETERS